MNSRIVTLRRKGLAFLTSITLFFTALSPVSADDRTDSFDLFNSYLVGNVDLASLYVFRSPTNANNTVLILLTAPFAQVISPPYFDPKARYEFKIDSTEDFKADITYRLRFGPPNFAGTQPLKLQRMIGRHPFTTIAEGDTATNLPVEGGGLVRAGIFDDPFFFDGFAYGNFINTGLVPFPRAPGSAKNLYGPNANILGIVLEIPSTNLVKEGQTANNTIIAVWGRASRNGLQVDRIGRPMTNLALIPPVPRSDRARDLRTRFNRGQPQNGLRIFGPSTEGIFGRFFGRTPGDAATLTKLFLPDVMFFQIGNPNGFGTFINNPDGNLGNVLGNGRRLRDDAIDFLLTVYTNGSLTTDNVPDDNGTKITDGNMATVAAFPYLGPANTPVTGPNP